MSNKSGEDHSIVFEDNVVTKKEFINQTLLDNTLCVAGSSFRGPAFVPMHITNQTDSLNISNTLVNSIGSDRQHSLGHVFDELNYFVKSQSFKAINMWVQNSGLQASFVRILGNDETSGGFNSQDITKSVYSLNENDSNKFAIAGSNDSGSTNLVKKEYCNRQIKINDDITLNSFEEIGLDIAATKSFITDLIVCPKGVVPYFLDVPSDQIGDFYNEPSDSAVDLNDSRFSIAKNIASGEYPTIIFRGFDAGKLNADREDGLRENRNFITLRKNNLYKANNYNSSWFNLYPSKIYENGHHLYSTYYDGEAFESGLKNANGTVDPVEYSLTRKANGDSFNNFRSTYTTAKTPWIISQAINSVKDSREDLYENVINLFRFFALDDGEVGNRFRIKINLKKRGDIVNNIFSEFDLYVMQYDARDNSFELLETYLDLNLNINSRNYICRAIGTKRKFYRVDENRADKKGKVFEEGLYDNVSSYLRVEVNPDIEFGKLRCDLMPCGFRAYPILNDTDAMPVPYFTNYLEDKVLGDNSNIKNSWGVLFRHLSYSNTNKTLSLKSEDSLDSDISPHYFYSKFFINDNLKESDTKYNSLFSLEKLVVKKSEIDSVVNQEEFTMFYKRSGSNITQPNPSNSIKYEYIDFNKLSYISNGVRQSSIYEYDESNQRDTTEFAAVLQDKLSFDFFTYGGFDGVNIYDYDQKNMTGNSVSLEKLDDDYLTYQQGNVITQSFASAKDLLMDYSNCNGDILILPGIREISFIRDTVDKINDERRFFYISDGVFDLQKSNIFKNIVISPDRSFQTENYEKDKVLINLEDYINNFYLFNAHEKNTIQSEVQNTSLYNLGLDNRHYMSVIGNILLEPKSNTFEKLNKSMDIIDPSIFVAAKMAQGIRNSIVDNALIYDAHDLNLINYDILAKTNVNFENLSKKSRENLFNFLYHETNSYRISLRSENTSYSTRRSIFTKQHQVRAIQFVKKAMMLNVFTDTSLIPGGILFSQISSLQNVYARFNVQITNLLDSLVENNIINAYQLDIPVVANDQTILDMKNNIIRGSVIIKLNRSGTNDIIRLSVQNSLNQLVQIQSIDDSIESELLLPASGY